MTVTSSFDALSGEHVLEVTPRPIANAVRGWNRRLNLFRGRSLSATALQTEQQFREGRLALLGQTLNPGVITGLEVGLERRGGQSYLTVNLGQGITVQGEPVALSHSVRVAWNQLPIQAPTILLNGTHGIDDIELGDNVDRELRVSLNDVLTSVPDLFSRLPRASILVLQPIVTEQVGNADPCDSCEQDPQNDAFEDRQRIDGCRLVLYAWPTDVIPLPVPGDDGGDGSARNTWRSRLAHALFQWEAQHRYAAQSYAAQSYAAQSYAAQTMRPFPWETLGVPIALIGSTAAGQPAFVDRSAVVRLGGGVRSPRLVLSLSELSESELPTPPTPRFTQFGYAALWQARVQQFAEQLVDTGILATREVLEGRSPNVRYLPPVGILPNIALEIDLGDPGDSENQTQIRNFFFPDDYEIQVAPVPVEQLDAVMQMSASLEHYDRQVPDQVMILVPVPQVVFEPNLLQTERISDEFEATRDEFDRRRTLWLLRRKQVRDIATLLVTAVKGEPPTYPDPDPHALVGEESVPDGPIDPSDTIIADDDQFGEPEDSYGTADENGTRIVLRLDALRSSLQTQTPLRFESVARLLGRIPDDVQFSPEIRDKIRHEPLSVDPPSVRLIFQGKMTEDEQTQLRQDLESIASRGNLTNIEQTVNRLYRTSQTDDLSQLDERGLEGFIEFLEGKVQRANDRIDLGFVRAQTDIYRFRQFMLGNIDASRLATSPALAGIAQGETAAATQTDLAKFLETVQDTPPVVRPPESTPVPGIPNLPFISPFSAEAPSRPGLRSLSISTGQPPSTPEGAPSVTTSMFLPGDATLIRQPSSGDRPFLSPDLQGDRPEARLDIPFDVIDQPQRIDPDRLDVTSKATADLFTEPFRAPETRATELFKPDSTINIIEQTPIIGKTYTFRTTTVAERLKTSPSLESKTFAVASKYSVVNEALNLELNIDDLQVPGFLQDTNGDGVREDEVSLNFQTIRDENRVTEILSGTHDPDPEDGDEAAFFAVGTRAVDNAIATLRLLEGRVQGYRVAIRLCQAALQDVNQLIRQVDRRLKVIGDELGEARHDVAVAQALFDEEIQRITDINQRRQTILDTQVNFLVFHRPRTVDLLASVPAQGLTPGGIAAPVPACLQDDEEVLPELQDAVDLLRDGPVKWFPTLYDLLQKLDRIDSLTQAVRTAKIRAAALPTTSPRITQLANQGQFGSFVYRAFQSQQQVVQRYRQQTALVDLGLFQGRSWKENRDRAKEVLSMGDLIDGNHKRSKVSKQASEELENIAQVAMCLYVRFGEVLPEIRVRWAELLSQFDQTLNLRSLASLPRWGEVDRRDRHDMQSLVDWLYQRINPTDGDAENLISDLIRIAILLASYAPVDEIITGQLTEDKVVKPGSFITLSILPAKVRIGMMIRTSFNGQPIEGVVENLLNTQAIAKITSTSTLTQPVTLARNTPVQFIEPRRFKRPHFSKRATRRVT